MIDLQQRKRTLKRFSRIYKIHVVQPTCSKKNQNREYHRGPLKTLIPLMKFEVLTKNVIKQKSNY